MSAEVIERDTVKRQITHVVFDLDGLLLDTEKLYTVCTQDILNRYGKIFDWSIKSQMMGRRPLEATQVLIDALQLPLTAEEFNKELYEKLYDMFPHAELMPGATRLVEHLHQYGVPMAIATGSKMDEYLMKMSNYPNLASCFSHVVCADNPQVQRGKPAPDIYQVAAQLFQSLPVSMEQVLVFEDAPNGVEAARAAGMYVIMVPDKRTHPDRTRLANKVLDSLENVDLEELGLPPFPKQ